MNTKQLITAAELQEEGDFALDHFGPNWRDNPAHRRILNALVDAEAAVRVFEDAARMRVDPSSFQPVSRSINETAAAVHAQAFHKLAATVFCPPAADEDEPERLRKAGAL